MLKCFRNKNNYCSFEFGTFWNISYGLVLLFSNRNLFITFLLRIVIFSYYRAPLPPSGQMMYFCKHFGILGPSFVQPRVAEIWSFCQHHELASSCGLVLFFFNFFFKGTFYNFLLLLRPITSLPSGEIRYFFLSYVRKFRVMMKELLRYLESGEWRDLQLNYLKYLLNHISYLIYLP